MICNIVMLVHNRARLTEQALDSLVGNTRPDSYTLTVVDDASGTATADMLRQFMCVGRVSILRMEPAVGIVGFARNLGIFYSERRFGRGDLLYLSDNDAYFAPGWLEGLVAVWPQADALGFRLLGANTHPFHGANETFNVGDFGEGRLELRTHDAIGGLSQSMRWETWDKYGPFDAHARGTNQSEDWAFCRKLIAEGYRVGTLHPYLVGNCGLTDSFGKPSPGGDAVRAQTEEFARRMGLEGKLVLE